MWMLTKAAAQTYRPSGLRATAVVGMVALMVAATVLLVLHVQLRFAIRDFNIQIRKIQKEQETLESRRSQLTSSLERLKSGERILQRAKEQGMVPYNPAEVATLAVSADRVDAWRGTRSESVERSESRPERQVAGSDIARRGVDSIESFLEVVKTRLAAHEPASS